MKSLNVIPYSEPSTELCAVEREVVKVKVAMDSAACDNVINPNELPTDTEYEPNDSGKHFVGANDSPRLHLLRLRRPPLSRLQRHEL